MKKEMNDKLRNKITELGTYTVEEQRWIADLDSEGIICRHNKTGAKIVLLSNQEKNKVFYIGFRTPPEDSTGVAHILEHSVLCGSASDRIAQYILGLYFTNGIKLIFRYGWYQLFSVHSGILI